MKHKKPENALNPAAELARVAALNRLLSVARVIRKNGTPEEADEALEWEKKLADRIAEIQELPKAA